MLERLPYGVFPFWFINTMMDSEKIESQIRAMREKGIDGFFFHARRGIDEKEIPPPEKKMTRETSLMWDVYYALSRLKKDTSYLKDKWWEMFTIALKSAEKYNLKVGIYDELDWPSGTAAQAITRNPKFQSKIIDRKGRVWRSPLYVDTLKMESVREFISRVHEEYAKRFSNLFGTRIIAVFSDEITAMHLYNMWNGIFLPWSEGLDLEKGIATKIFAPPPKYIGEKFRYWNTLSLSLAKYHRTLREWCESHNLIYTGHVLLDEPCPFQVKAQGNILDHMREFTVPGTDQLSTMFGGSFAKLPVSAAHHKNCNRAMIEAFGWSGWQLKIEHLYYISNWILANGINLIVPHAIYASIEGFRKHESPPCHMHSRIWEGYSTYSSYVKHISTILGKMQHDPHIAVYFPVETMFALHDGSLLAPRVAFVTNEIEAVHISLGYLMEDYEFLDFRVIQNAEVEDGSLCLGNEKYDTIIFPAALVLEKNAWEKIREAIGRGVKAVFTSFMPSYIVDEQGDVRETRYARHKEWFSMRYYHPIPLVPVLTSLLAPFACENVEWIMQKIPWTGGECAVKGNIAHISTTAGMPYGKKGGELIARVLSKKVYNNYVRIYKGKYENENIAVAFNGAHKRCSVKKRLYEDPLKICQIKKDRIELPPYSVAILYQ
ncbi:MAG: hypothetical protein QXL15_01035 [Candidatus Korarchaeota archaeon]